MEIKYYLYNHWAVVRDQPYGVVIKPFFRGRVDAARQPYPIKRLTPMGLLRVEVRRNDVILSGGWVHEQMRGRGDALIYKGGRVGSM